jgi:hypothetical protein
LSIGNINSSFKNITIFDAKLANVTNLSSLTTTINGSNKILNAVRYLKLYINPNTKDWNRDYSYVVIGNLSNIQNNSFISVKYNYEFLNPDNTFANTSNIGYNSDSLLQLGLQPDSFKVPNPFVMPFRTTSGDCINAANADTEVTVVELRLGKNEFFSCRGNNSAILTTLTNTFNYIGKMGASNTKLTDYVKVEWAPNTESSASSQNLVITIYYTKVGAARNPQYYIVKTTSQLIEPFNNNIVVFFEYQ